MRRVVSVLAGMLLGAHVSLADWWIWNQIPVTVGNVLGGMVFTGLALHVTYGLSDIDPRQATALAGALALPFVSSHRSTLARHAETPAASS